MNRQTNTPNPRRTPRRTQRQRRERSRSRMLAAAVALIARQGSSRTTLSQIGERSGYTHGLVSHRFGSKGQLVRTLVRKLQDDFAKSIQPALAGRRGLRALKFVAEGYLRAAARGERLAMYVLIGEALGPVPEIRADLARADENFRRAIRQQLEDGIRAGDVRASLDPATQAALIVAALRGLVIQRLLDADAFDLDKACKELVANLERALRPEESRADA